MRTIVSLFALALLAGSASAADAEVDVGTLDGKKPKKEELVAPKKDAGVVTVDLHASVLGKVSEKEKRNVYVVVCPLGKGEGGADFWVQQAVTKDGEKVSGDAQFGEEAVGAGEYFAVMAVATDTKWTVGQKLDALPDDATYSKVKIVKRK